MIIWINKYKPIALLAYSRLQNYIFTDVAISEEQSQDLPEEGVLFESVFSISYRGMSTSFLQRR